MDAKRLHGFKDWLYKPTENNSTEGYQKTR